MPSSDLALQATIAMHVLCVRGGGESEEQAGWHLGF